MSDISTSQSTSSDEPSLSRGDVLTLTVDRMAHGGEGIAVHEGRVVFVRGGFPGDHLTARLTQVKKSFLKAQVEEILRPSSLRVPTRCPAAAAGAGCCDFSVISPEAELEIKGDILKDQSRRVGKLAFLPAVEKITLQPTRGWRTRVRMGVDKEGRAGMRALGSTEVIPVACTQVVPGLLDGLVGEGARTFTPGAEVLAVLDSEGQRHVVEIRKAPRGRRSERITQLIEGSPEVVQYADGHRYRFPLTAFWQAHRSAPSLYAGIVRTWLLSEFLTQKRPQVGWDLYGGVGLFVPALADALGAGQLDSEALDHTDAGDVEIHSVDLSEAAAEAQAMLSEFPVVFHRVAVEKIVNRLPDPTVVVLDPPRSGVGSGVIKAVARRNPDVVIHIGCDPATLMRDVATWQTAGYQATRMTLVDAFPGTHHFEVITMLKRSEIS